MTQTNTVENFQHDGNRYDFDSGLCSAKNGWAQYDTREDASYFGVWVHLENRWIFTFAEGDATSVKCPTAELFALELARMAEAYGPPPPSMIGIDSDGTVTEFYDTRPAVAS